MILFHDRLATSMVLYLLLAGLWGLGSYFARRGVTSAYWGILVIGELLILAQAVTGVALWLDGARPGRTIHILYGAVAAITLPAYYATSRGQDDRRTALYYGLACLFLAGISLRGMTTAS